MSSFFVFHFNRQNNRVYDFTISHAFIGYCSGLIKSFFLWCLISSENLMSYRSWWLHTLVCEGISRMVGWARNTQPEFWKDNSWTDISCKWKWESGLRTSIHLSASWPWMQSNIAASCVGNCDRHPWGDALDHQNVKQNKQYFL